LQLGLDQSVEDGFSILVLVANDDGEFGEVESLSVTPVTVGTGELQVSVAWDAPSDVDLWLDTPSEESIGYSNKTGTNGEELDLDSNPSCTIDGTNQENITVPVVASGEYRVRVNYYDDCGEAETDYVVTVRAKGREPQVFEGSFVPEDDGADHEIVTLTFP
jgi:uncharacterized protein YfaP (DUF2135 family)